MECAWCKELGIEETARYILDKKTHLCEGCTQKWRKFEFEVRVRKL